MPAHVPPTPDAAALMSWAASVDSRLWGLEAIAERFAERTCAKVAASGPDAAACRAVAALRERVLAVAGTLRDAAGLLEKKAAPRGAAAGSQRRPSTLPDP